MKVGAVINDPNASDMDFMMDIETDQGKKCTVSPVNKYCAYAQHSSDQSGSVEKEYVNIKRLAVAKYMTYVGKSSDFKSTCP